MKKALIICEVFFPEDFIINDLASEWYKKGYDLEVLTKTPSYPYGKTYKGYKNRLYQKTEYNGIKIHRFPVISGYNKSLILKILNYFNYLFFSTIIILFIGKRYDRIFIYQTGPLTQAFAGVIAKKIYGCKLTIWSQDLWPDSVYAFGFKKSKLLVFFLNWIVRLIYKNCDKVLVSCEGFLSKLETYIPNKKIHYIPNWPLINKKSIKQIKLPGKFNFTFTGNIGKMQNLENVILGFNLFSKNNPNVYLNIIGDGSHLESLKKVVKDNLIENVNFTGRKPLEDMPCYFESSDVLILSLIDKPIYEITIPSKFQTYLTASKPIYAIMKGEVKDIVEKYEIGLTASPSNINEISDGFYKLFQMKNDCISKISKKSNELLINKFNRDNLIVQIDNIFWE